jgi:hypothetical protein
VTIVDRRCLVEEASAMQKEAQLGSIEAISSANRSRSRCSPRPCARRRTNTVLSKPLLCANDHRVEGGHGRIVDLVAGQRAGK